MTATVRPPAIPNLAAVLARGADAAGRTVTGLGAPTSDADAATKAYVDANAGGAPLTDPGNVWPTTTDVTTSYRVAVVDGDVVHVFEADSDFMTNEVEPTWNLVPLTLTADLDGHWRNVGRVGEIPAAGFFGTVAALPIPVGSDWLAIGGTGGGGSGITQGGDTLVFTGNDNMMRQDPVTGMVFFGYYVECVEGTAGVAGQPVRFTLGSVPPYANTGSFPWFAMGTHLWTIGGVVTAVGLRLLSEGDAPSIFETVIPVSMPGLLPGDILQGLLAYPGQVG